MKATVYKSHGGQVLGVREEEEGILVRTYCGDCAIWLGGDGGDHFGTPTHKHAERRNWPDGPPRSIVVEVQEKGRVVSDSRRDR